MGEERVSRSLWSDSLSAARTLLAWKRRVAPQAGKEEGLERRIEREVVLATGSIIEKNPFEKIRNVRGYGDSRLVYLDSMKGTLLLSYVTAGSKIISPLVLWLDQEFAQLDRHTSQSQDRL